LDRELACFRSQPLQKTANIRTIVEEELTVAEKFLWDPNAALSPERRRVLKGLWVYDASFRKCVEQSTAQGESAVYRWIRLGMMAIRHPELWTVPEFRRRVGQLARRPFGHAKEPAAS
jgi:hypothetical protein